MQEQKEKKIRTILATDALFELVYDTTRKKRIRKEIGLDRKIRL